MYPSPGVYTVMHYAYNNACSDSSSIDFQAGGATGAALDSLASQSYSLNAGTMSDPDVICSGESLVYVYRHPDGFPDSTHWKNWEVVESSIKTLNNQEFAMDFDFEYPSANGPLRVVINDSAQGNRGYFSAYRENSPNSSEL